MSLPRDLLEQADREIEAAEGLIHGLRTSYKRGCHCVRCRAAEASYRADLRRLEARGLVPPGRRVSAVETRRRVRSLLLEQFSRQRLARQAHLHPGTLRPHTGTVTLRTHLRVLALWRRHCGEGE